MLSPCEINVWLILESTFQSLPSNPNLVSVSVGELGTSTLELEEKLREILEVACVWDAVVLIDEAGT